MSNSNINLQTQSSNALHNAIMEAGSKDRPPMLAPGNYVQWKSRIKRYIDTKPNNELIHYCLQNPPYTYQWAEKTVPVAEGSSETTTERYMENYKNVSQDIRDQLNAEAEAVQIILTGIDNDIYSTVDACPNACEILKTSTHNTNIPPPDHKQSTETRKQLLPLSPTYDLEPCSVAEDDEMSKEKEIDKLMALISLSFKKIYKPTNNNLRTSSNTSRANQDNSPRINRGIEEYEHPGHLKLVIENIWGTMVTPISIFDYWIYVMIEIRDGKNLDKMKEKSDACIFVGYSTQSKAYRVFNKGTRMIVETIHVNFDELPQMASDYVSSDPVHNVRLRTPVQEQGETSSRHVDSSNMHTFYQHHPSAQRWTKDHPLEQVIGNPSQSIRTRRQLETQMDGTSSLRDMLKRKELISHERAFAQLLRSGVSSDVHCVRCTPNHFRIQLWERQTAFLFGPLKERVVREQQMDLLTHNSSDQVYRLRKHYIGLKQAHLRALWYDELI
ncbi:integrase, catalytic region, zinc finger, CCHC-type containing protein [Tanacetum coccineum]